MKKIALLPLFFLPLATAVPVRAQSKSLTPLKARVNVQADSARANQIIDGRWVAVGTNKPHTICLDHSLPFRGRPSYRFELKQDDNTLEGYAEGETKGRAELSYCYAVSNDFRDYPASEYPNARKMKTVYHYGKGERDYTQPRNARRDHVLPPERQGHRTPHRGQGKTPDRAE